jgi:hypothetical protein
MRQSRQMTLALMQRMNNLQTQKSDYSFKRKEKHKKDPIILSNILLGIELAAINI